MSKASEIAKSLRLVGLTEVDEAADLIEQQAAKIAELATDLERTRNERNAAQVQARREISKEYRDYIAKLEAQIATVAPAVDAQPVASDGVRHFNYLCSLLPEGFHWSDPLTPDVMSHIVSAASAQSEGLRKDAVRREALEEAAKVCEEMILRDMSDEDLQTQRCADAIRALSQKDPQ